MSCRLLAASSFMDSRVCILQLMLIKVKKGYLCFGNRFVIIPVYGVSGLQCL